MNESIISWTNRTWNPTHGCSKVSDGCKYCYAMTLSLRRGWTKKPWTIQNEVENVLLKPHKLSEPFKLKTSERIFVNSMSDLFHVQVPDWYRAAIFAVMIANPQHVFQILTKRADDNLIKWTANFLTTVKSPEYDALIADVPRKVKDAMQAAKSASTPWASNIWMGASVEDSRVLNRIDFLRRCHAQVKFISAEPLLGDWGNTDLLGIDWVIAGGESGLHLRSDDHPRWMQQEWARNIKNLCVDQGVAFFYKQDSGIRTEMRSFLTEDDGTRWKWEQYPGDLRPPVNIDNPVKQSAWDWERTAYNSTGYYADIAALNAAYLYATNHR